MNESIRIEKSYNKRGKLKNEVYYNEFDKVIEVRNYDENGGYILSTFNENEMLVGEYGFDKDDNIISQMEYVYEFDENNNVIKKIGYGDNVYERDENFGYEDDIYERDENFGYEDDIYERDENLKRYECEYTYDEYGRKTHAHEYTDSYHNLIFYDGYGCEESCTKYGRDEKLLEEIKYKYDGGYRITKYDEAGKIINVAEYDEDDDIISKIEYDESGNKKNRQEYKYDNEGNLIPNSIENEKLQIHSIEEIAQGINLTKNQIDEVLEETLKQTTIEKENKEYEG